MPSLPTTASAIGINAGGTATGSVTLTNAGVFERFRTQSGTNTIQNWINGGSVFVGQFESRWTTLTGSLSTGTAGTWQGLSTSRTWSRTGVGVDTSCTGTLEIRRISSGAVVATCSVTLEGNGGT